MVIAMNIMLIAIIACICVHNCMATQNLQLVYQQRFVSWLPECIQKVHEFMKEKSCLIKKSVINQVLDKKQILKKICLDIAYKLYER